MAFISIILPSLDAGGAERVNLELARALSELGHTVEIVLLHRSGSLLHEAELNFMVVDLNVSKNWHIPFLLRRYIRNRQPDSIIVSMWALTAFSAFARLLLLKHTKMILVEHSILSKQFENQGVFRNAFLRISVMIAYRLADSCVGVSKGVVKDMAILSRMPIESFHTIYNPVPIMKKPDTASILNASLFWGEEDVYRIITVGSLKEAKNYSLLLHSVAILKKRLKVKLVILGEGDLRKSMVSLVVRLDISDQVVMPGFFQDPTPFYYAADVFVLSSNREGLPTVIIEAMACGVPIVSTDCESGPAEILNNGDFGILVPLNDPEKLADAIEAALKKEHNKDILYKRACDFDPQVAASSYLDLII